MIVYTNDIFRSKQHPYSIYKTVESRTRLIDNDPLYFAVSLTYKIFQKEIKVRSEQGNADVLERTK